MTNSMPTFAVLRNKVIIGYVSAVSHAQAMQRAATVARDAGYRRFEIMAEGNVELARGADRKAGYVDHSYNGGRSPYATPGLEERRAALIAAHKAGAL